MFIFSKTGTNKEGSLCNCYGFNYQVDLSFPPIVYACEHVKFQCSICLPIVGYHC